MKRAIELGAYFYPLTTHCSVRQTRAEAMGRNSVVDETSLAQNARSLFPGHRQPIKYALDKFTTRWDDSDPSVVAQQVDLATDAGINFFVFDTYEGVKDGKPQKESQQPIDIFRGLSSDTSMRYAKLETFASPRVVLPVSSDPFYEEPGRMYDMDENTARFIVDTCVENDWEHPNYFRVNDRPYLSLFIPGLTSGWNVSSSRVRHIVGELHDYAQTKYQMDPYIVGSIRTQTQAEDLTAAGVDALTGYAFLPNFGDNTSPLQQYEELLEERKEEWDMIAAVNTFVPPAVVGWDASPRGKSSFQVGITKGPSYAPIVVGSSASSFEGMLRDSLDYVETTVPPSEQYGVICAWNEITEGAALLPQVSTDGDLDTSYLDAVKRVTNRK